MSVMVKPPPAPLVTEVISSRASVTVMSSCTTSAVTPALATLISVAISSSVFKLAPKSVTSNDTAFAVPSEVIVK